MVLDTISDMYVRGDWNSNSGKILIPLTGSYLYYIEKVPEPDHSHFLQPSYRKSSKVNLPSFYILVSNVTLSSVGL